MRFAFTLATLVAFAAAAPTEKGTDATGGGYSSYRPYTAYGVYPGAADAEAARMQTEAHLRRAEAMLVAHETYAQDMEKVKRHVMSMLPGKKTVEARDEAVEADQKESGYGKYNPYWYYAIYPKVMDEAAGQEDEDVRAGAGME
ncbi:hypothetical protein IAQ61_008128 [Plenodomus lingam]|uniref:uncharacterized protein n=1 Tax=Leptosphaeria maculans TaxID=5022 RepID=UPI00332D3C77|nr:hypothetical protein IAQ61_008128 [Plenodomus lingam]